MRYLKYLALPVLLAFIVLSCEKEGLNLEGEVPQEIIDKIAHLGFNPDGIEAVEEGYRIERDIIITHEFLNSVPKIHEVPGAEQYRTFNLVATGGSRTITVYLEEESGGDGGGGGGGGGGPPAGKGPNAQSGRSGGGGSSSAAFSSTYGLALNEAISRFNGESLTLNFERVTTTSADIVFTRLSKRDENRGVLGSAGFPTDSGDPYGEIKMSGVLESNYGLSVNGIATIMAHEMGHCIGFRHTDYFDRSISCGSGGNEGQETTGVGAVHIPNTPTGASLADQSWMLSCTDGSDRPFNGDDKTALSELY